MSNGKNSLAFWCQASAGTTRAARRTLVNFLRPSLGVIPENGQLKGGLTALLLCYPSRAYWKFIFERTWKTQCKQLVGCVTEVPLSAARATRGASLRGQPSATPSLICSCVRHGYHQDEAIFSAQERSISSSGKSAVMCALEVLVGEIENIVRCPYVPCLKRLHDISMQEDCPVEDWALLHQCSVDSLAGVVLQGLELFPYALDILMRFSRIPIFRDAVLQQQPSLLDILLGKASESESKFVKYAPSCISMLSSPIQVALPASYPKFLSKLLEGVAQQLSYQTIEPVHKLISALGASHMRYLPPDLHNQIHETLVNSLKTLDLEEHSTNLLNLATLAHISSHSNPVRKIVHSYDFLDNSAESDGIEPNVSAALATSQQFFHSRKAHKVLDLVTLKAILISSTSTNLEEDQIIRSLSLCSDIVSAISIDERAAWYEKSSGKVRKLYDRLLRQDLAQRTQAAILEFLLLLIDERGLPANVCEIMSRLLTNFHHSIKASFFQMSLIYLEPSIVGNMLFQILENLNAGGPLDVSYIRQLEHFQTLTRSIDRRSQVSPDLNKAVTEVACGEKGQQLLSAFLTSKNSFQDLFRNKDGKRCFCNVLRLEFKVRSSLGVLLLKCMLRHMIPKSDYLSKLADWLAERKWNDEDIPCSWQCQNQKARLSAVSLFEAGSTPTTSSVSQGWRDSLIQDMSRDAHNRSEWIIRSVGEVCRDLEARCDKVEAPLRREKERVMDLESRLADAETHSLDLQTELETNATTIRNLQSEKKSLLDQSNHSAERVKEMSTRLAAAHAELKQAREDTENRTAILTERYRQQDLTYLAILTGKDEKYDEQAKSLSATKERANVLEIELQQSKEDRDKLTEKTNANATLIESQEKIIDELKSASEQEAKTREELLQTKNDLVTINKELQMNMTESLRAKDSAITDLSERLRTAETTNTRCSEQYSRAIADRESTRNELMEERQVKMEACQKLNEHEKTIACQQAQLATLRKERDARLREFAEAQDLSNKLIAIVGMKRPAQSLSPSSPHRGSSQRYPAPMTSMRRDSTTTPHTVKNMKAKRRHNQTTILSPVQPLRGDYSLALKENSRSPLTERSEGATNASPPKQVTKQILDVAMENDEGFDESFNDSDIFTSTEQNKLIEVDQRIRGNAWDETTMDS